MGNNNPYAHDDETSWYDWDDVDPAFVDFAGRLVALRRANPALRRRTWLTGITAGGPDSHDVSWLDDQGLPMTLAEWAAADTRAVAMVLNGDVLRPLDLDLAPLGAASAMVLANGSATPVDMTIAGRLGRRAMVRRGRHHRRRADGID